MNARNKGLTSEIGENVIRLLPVMIIWAALAVQGNAHAKQLRWVNQGDVQTMDPYSQNEGVTTNINQHIYERLVERDEKLAIIPGLAERWTQVDPLTWRFHLHKGVRFHDGTPFTADDVVFSAQRAVHPNSQIASSVRALGTPVKVDDHTVEFRLERVNPIFLQHLDALMIMSRVWAIKHHVERPQDFKAREASHAALNANGTGPFILKQRQPDVRTVLTLNPGYWNPSRIRSNVTEIIFTPISSDATRLAALLSGEVDLLQDPAPQDLPRLHNTPSVSIASGHENRVIFLGFDQVRDELLFSNIKGRNPFKDKRVRQAIYQAIDIEAIRVKTMRGLAIPTGCLIPAPIACEVAPGAEKRLDFDPEASLRLLSEAGYPAGFEITLHCPNNRYVNDEEICKAVAPMLTRIGVKTRLVAEPRPLYFPRLERGEVSMFMLGWGGAITDAQTTLDAVYHSKDDRQRKGYFNLGRFSDPRLDSLIDQAAGEANAGKRQELLRDAVFLHNQEVRHVPLHRQTIPWAMRRGVRLVHAADNHVRVWWLNID